MILELWKNFTKKENSTAYPSENGESRNVVLKESTSIDSPTFLISNPNFDFNYCKFNNKYYFINDIRLESNSLYAIDCSIDVLASYKTEIGNYTCYVERASSSFNKNIPDSFLSSSQKWVSLDNKIKVVFDLAGCYVIRVVGSGFTKHSSGDEGVLTYALDSGSFVNLIDFLFTDANFQEIFSLNTLAKAVFNPFEYILSVKWFPLPVSTWQGNREFVPFGWWDSGGITPESGQGAVLGYRVLSNSWTPVDSSIEMFDNYYDDWRDASPLFTRYDVYLPGVGVISLNPQDVENAGGFSIVPCVDLITGSVVYTISSGGNIVSYVKGNIGIDVPIAQSNLQATSILQGATNLVGGIATGSVSSITSGVIETASGMIQPSQNIIGGAGNISEIRYNSYIKMMRRVLGSASYPTNVLGRPLCSNVKLNTLSGYIKCAGASITLKGYSSHRERINGYLNGGFYYE